MGNLISASAGPVNELSGTGTVSMCHVLLLCSASNVVHGASQDQVLDMKKDMVADMKQMWTSKRVGKPI